MNYSTQSDGYKVQASIKVGQHGQHMLNVRADTVDELLRLMDELGGSSGGLHHSIDALVDGVPTEAQAIQNVHNGFPGTTPVQPGVIQPQQPPTYGNQPDIPRVCPGHNLPWREYDGVKNDKAWHGYFCAAPKDGPIPQCKPIFRDR